MKLIKTSLLSSCSAVSKIASLLVLTKIISVVSGPEGLSFFGQVQNVTNIIYIFAGGMLSTAVIKYSSSRVISRRQVLNTALSLGLIMVLIVDVTLISLKDHIAEYFFYHDDNSYILTTICLVAPFYMFNVLIVSFLNGIRKIGVLTKINILANVISVLYCLCGLLLYSIKGVIFCFITSYILTSIITVCFTHKARAGKFLKNYKFNVSLEISSKLYSIALISVVAVFSSSLSIILVRNHMVSTFGMNAAGLWQSVWSLSQTLLMLVIMTLSTYAMPKLSSAKAVVVLHREVKKVLCFVLFLSMTMLAVTFIFGEVLIEILFSKEFSGMKDTLVLQMFGNVIKSFGWVYGYVMVSKAQTKITIFGEIFNAILFVFLTMALSAIYYETSPVYAYVVSASFHSALMYIFYRAKFKADDESYYNHTRL
jgi:PST family polysaccharide transporter